jgi:hypothetical protein
MALLLMPLGLMVGCVALVLTLVGETVRDPSHEIIVAVACALVAMWAFVTLPMGEGGGRPGVRGLARWRGLAGRTLVVGTPFSLAIAGAAVLFRNDGAIIGVAALAVISWVTGRDARRLATRVREGSNEGRVFDPVGAILARFMVGGLILFVACALTQPTAEILAQSRPLPVVQLTVAFSCYFLTGIAAVAWARHLSLGTRWRIRHALVAPHLGSRWITSVAVVTALAAACCVVIGVVIVTGAYDPVVVLVGGGAKAVTGGVTRVLELFRVVAPNTGRNIPHHNPHGRGHHQHVANGSRGMNWILLILDIAGTVAALAVIAYVERAWLRARLASLIAWLRSLRLFRRMGALSYGHRVIRRELPEVRIGMVKRAFPGLMSPRERVLYDYDRMLQRAARQGRPRGIGRTAGEFEFELAPLLGTAEADVHVMTAAFVEARYSLHVVSEREAGLMHESWKRVKAALGRISVVKA